MRTLICSFILLFCLSAQAQKNPTEYTQFSAGIGIGLDYGGFGVQFRYSPIKQAFAFGAVGFNTLNAGYNVGAGYRFLPDKKFCPYVVGMYGYNAIVVAMVNGERDPDLTQVFYGPTFGLGGELKTGQKRKNSWNFELLVPIRLQPYKDHVTLLEQQYGAEFFVLPIAISVGYHFGF